MVRESPRLGPDTEGCGGHGTEGRASSNCRGGGCGGGTDNNRRAGSGRCGHTSACLCTLKRGPCWRPCPRFQYPSGRSRPSTSTYGHIQMRPWMTLQRSSCILSWVVRIRSSRLRCSLQQHIARSNEAMGFRIYIWRMLYSLTALSKKPLTYIISCRNQAISSWATTTIQGFTSLG